MFDVGFSELLLIGVVALLVIGPERLPGVARTAGKWVARARRFVGDVKRDIEEEIRAEEIKKAMEEHRIKNPLHEVADDARRSFDEIKQQTGAVVDAAKRPHKRDPDDKSDS